MRVGYPKIKSSKYRLKLFTSTVSGFIVLFFFAIPATTQTINGQWIPLNPDGVRPVERVGWQKLVYDEKHDVIWLFAAAGGDLYQAYANDVWLYDVKQNSWKQVQKISAKRNPPDRPSWRHAEQGRTYDASKGLIILFGQQSNAGPKNDTWTFDVGTLTWEEIKPTGDVPPLPHFEYALEYDRAADVSVLWGGNRAYTYPYPSDVWELNLTKRVWKKYPFAPPNAPIGRRAHGMAYCDSLGGIIMSGGSSEYGDNPSINYNDVWLYRATDHSWKELKSINPPPGRRHFGFDYDPIHNVCLLFSGGVGIEEVEEVYRDTWIYDVSTGVWSPVHSDINPPPYGSGDLLVFARKHDSFLLMAEDGNIWKFELGYSPLNLKEKKDVPNEFRLMGNYPNPFNPSTRIAFSLPNKTEPTIAIVNIFDVRGRKVRSLSAGPFSGVQRGEIVWNGKDDSGRDLPSGVYPYQVVINGSKKTSKMILMR